MGVAMSNKIAIDFEKIIGLSIKDVAKANGCAELWIAGQLQKHDLCLASDRLTIARAPKNPPSQKESKKKSPQKGDKGEQ